MPPKREKNAKKVTVNGNQQLHDVGNESENDNDLWLERGDHPLLNDVVLKTLFVFVKPKDLKACRLVCKKWTDLSLPLAKSTFQVTIHGDDSKAKRITDFVDLFGSNNCLGIPFTKFTLGSFDPTTGFGDQFIPLCGEMASKFVLLTSISASVFLIQDFGELLRSTPNLKYLELPFTYDILQFGIGPRSIISTQSQSVKSDEVKLFPGPRETPSLKCLKTLDIGTGLVDEYRKNCPTFFEELLTVAENISTLITHNPASTLELLKTVEKLGTESKIEILSLPEINTGIRDVMHRMIVKPVGLKLKHLKLKCGSMFPTTNLPWVHLVELMNGSLVSLRINYINSVPTNFPRMPNLKLLDFGIYVLPRSTEMIKIQNFNNCFPALQYLRLVSDSENNILDEFFVGSESCPLMESLSLGSTEVNFKTFEGAIDMFPNLKELELDIVVDGTEILQKIWTQMSRLEKLNISGHLSAESNIESLITGVPIEEIKIIRKRLKKFKIKTMTKEVRRQTISELIKKHLTLPSIRNLTNLRHMTLSLTAGERRHKTFLSDLTGYFGLYTLKNLQHLNISDCQFSEACSEILVADMELDSWNFQRPRKEYTIPFRWKSDSDEGDWSFPSPKFSIDLGI